MSFFKYLKDKFSSIVFCVFIYLIILMFMITLKASFELIISVSFLLFLEKIVLFSIDFYRKKQFYDGLVSNINNLDKAYLVLETLNKPNFYDGEILFESLYYINKSMIDNVNNYKRQVTDFKDYIEMWIHEVKIPLSSCILKVHNNKDKYSDDMKLQLRRVDDYLEQVLYYVRSENASSDYVINKVFLSKCVNNVALRNKDMLLDSNISLIVSDVEVYVYTDSKWLEFMLNQIVNNSIKYSKRSSDSVIKISSYKDNDQVVLVIYDNGIGVSESDVSRVFLKCFTGSNGRNSVKSTGMGLFIVKSLCDKLGHKIKFESIKGEFTKVSIIINSNKYYDEVR